MGRRTIELDEDAYERLQDRRQEGESISEVIRRLTGERSWREVEGIWDGDIERLESTIEAGRERSRKRSEQLCGDRRD
jgi:predicted CopG family antitoxin